MAAEMPFHDLRFTAPPAFFYWDRDYHWSPPTFTDFDLWCILEGKGEVTLRDHIHPLVPGRCFLLRPGDQPFGRHDPAHPLVAFYGHFDMLDRRGRKIPPARVALPPPGLELHDLQWFHTLARICVNACHRSDPLGLRQSRHAFQLMLAQVWEWSQTPPPSPADTALRKIIAAIQRHPSRPWPVTEMADSAGLSCSQFTRRFQRLTGKSPQSFVIHNRLALARQLILETDLSLTQIASDLGYNDLYFFSRQFKTHFRQPPSELRASHALRRARG